MDMHTITVQAGARVSQILEEFRSMASPSSTSAPLLSSRSQGGPRRVRMHRCRFPPVDKMITSMIVVTQLREL